MSFGYVTVTLTAGTVPGSYQNNFSIITSSACSDPITIVVDTTIH